MNINEANNKTLGVFMSSGIFYRLSSPSKSDFYNEYKSNLIILSALLKAKFRELNRNSQLAVNVWSQPQI